MASKLLLAALVVSLTGSFGNPVKRFAVLTTEY